ncbi:MAG: arsenate reductase ArsC [Nitrospirae bacterium]|nr:arsenate reductase ArsC [Nitrospirota bacterium]
MAEGWFRDLAHSPPYCGRPVRRKRREYGRPHAGPPDRPVFSAGSHPSIVHPLAIQAMGEVGINITSHRSKGIDSIPLDQVGTVITLCAEEVCPVLPGEVKRLHWPLPDPVGAGTTPIEGFRRVRDELARRIRIFLRDTRAV